MMNLVRRQRGLVLFSLLVLCRTASAHHLPPGFEEVDEFDHQSFTGGLLHPLTGLDHIVTFIAAGWIAFAMARSTRSLAAMAVSFIAGLALGNGGIALPMLEQGLSLSVLAAGVMLLTQWGAAAPIILSVIAFWHGNAHGGEMPGFNAASGLLLASASLTAFGFAIGSFASKHQRLTTLGGAAVCVIGLALCALRIF
jgi:urease accessory protein